MAFSYRKFRYILRLKKDKNDASFEGTEQKYAVAEFY